MASSVTSAGAASGIDFESIISASVSAKKTKLESQVTTKKENAQIELTGVGKLKSALSSFTDILDEVAKKNSFNKRSVVVKQDTSDPVMTVETKDDASNGNYNITVTQLAQSTSYSTNVEDSTAKLGAGTMTFSIGEGDDAKSFSIDVGEDDTLETLRKKINQNGENFGVTANILTLSDGSSKFVLDSGNTGDAYSNFSISSTGSDSLSVFNASVTTDDNGNKVSSGNMDLVRAGQDAKIEVDGATLTSSSNTFNDTIKGVDGNESTGFKSNNVSVSTDTASVKSMIESFISTYNDLRTTLDDLSARNTYTNGTCNDDGGYLAGDSTCSTIKSSLSNMLSSFSINSSSMNNIFAMGIEMDNDGNLSLDSDTFDDAIDNNYEQVVAAFSGDNGICSQMSESLKDYTKTGGILALREDSLNSDIRDYEQKEADNTTFLAKYEESLRSKYASLDTLVANLNQSLSYLSSALNTGTSSS